MKRLLLCVLLGLTACGSDPADPEPGPQGQQEEVDYCTEFGWYGDGHCDDICPLPDPDCAPSGNNSSSPGNNSTEPAPGPGPGPSPDPDPTDPPEPVPVDPVCEDLTGDNIDWVSMDPDECAEIRFTCGDGWRPFSSEECGCGCIQEFDTGLACLDDSVDTVERYGDVEECQLIDYVCDEGWTHFSDDCGCGCRLVCSDDFECDDGYCETGVDAEPFCVYPNCDDGSELACRAAKPTCYDTDVAAIVNGCWECLDARTCGPSMGP